MNPQSPPEIRDIKGWIALSESNPWVIALLVGLALLAGYFLWRAFRKKRDESLKMPEVPSLPPDAQALRDLEELKKWPLEGEKLRRFHFRLSEVLRTYLEGQFKIAATDLTFEELRTQLGDLPISDDLREELIRWSQQSELVKFADLRITQEESLQMCDWASKFVRETRPQSEEEKPT